MVSTCLSASGCITCLAIRLTCYQSDDSLQTTWRSNFELERNGQARRSKADISLKKNHSSLKENHFSLKKNDFSLENMIFL